MKAPPKSQATALVMQAPVTPSTPRRISHLVAIDTFFLTSPARYRQALEASPVVNIDREASSFLRSVTRMQVSFLSVLEICLVVCCGCP